MAARNGRGRTTARRLLNSVLSSPWFVKEDWLQEFAGLAEDARSRGDDLTASEFREKLRAALASLERDAAAPEAIALSLGDPLGPGLRATVRDQVAIIPVMGPLYHYASEFDDVCGCSSYEQVAQDLQAALNSPDVSAILLNVDSPGGEVAGCGELAQMIYDSRSVKPSTSYVSDLACSAGYYLASSAETVVIARSSVLGSIGVVMTYLDKSERDAKSGVRRVEILSSQSPRKRADPNTDEGRAQIQEMLDDLAQVFIEDVARNRGVSVDTVLSDFGRGGMMVGARAVTAGLADRIGSFEGVLAELAQHARARPAAGGGPFSPPSMEHVMAKENDAPAAEPKPAPITAELIASEHPAIAEAFRAEGATRERTRILGIEEYAVAGFETVITECKADPACSPEAAAARVLKAQIAAPSKPGAAVDPARNHLANLAGTEAALDAPKPSAAAPEAGSTEAQVASILNAGRVPAATR